MRKRLRKKKHRGEFTLLGFEIEGAWDLQKVTEPLQDAFVDGLIDVVEARGLCVGGGDNPKTFGYYVTKWRYTKGKHPRRWIDVSATDEDRVALETFLRERTPF